MTKKDETLTRYENLNPFEWLEGHLGFADKDQEGIKGELEQSVFALGVILTFLQNSSIKSNALSRIHLALTELMLGSAPAKMLKPRTKARRPSDPAGVDLIKGGLAGIMEVRIRSGMSARGASQWVIDHTSHATKQKVGDPTKITAHTVMKWRERFSQASTTGLGRDNYLRIVRTWQSYQRAAQPDQAVPLLRAIERLLIPNVPSRL